jgi:hypothetical protein
MHYFSKNKCAMERIRFTLQKVNHHLLLGILPFKANLQKNYTHTHTKQEWILSFQNQCLLIVEPLPCSTTCIVFLHSTKKTTNIILNFHIELIVSLLSPPQSFLSKTFFVNDKTTKKPNDFRQYESDEHI